MKIVPNFGGIPKKYSTKETSSIAVLPVPYDGTSTWIKGADKGPNAILEASANMELYDVETRFEVYKKGIYTAKALSNFSSVDKMVEAVYKEISSFLIESKFPVLIGGEHSVSIGAIQAVAKQFKDLTILQIDAHGDTRESYEGSAHNHACVMARARELCPIVQVGIRSMDESEGKIKKNQHIFFAHDIMRMSREKWIKKVISKLSKNVYITIDLDGFDSSIMPSTGTPEPGGLGWYDVTTLMRQVTELRKVVGFDVVELCPNPIDKAPNFLAAKLIYTILSYQFSH